MVTNPNVQRYLPDQGPYLLPTPAASALGHDELIRALALSWSLAMWSVTYSEDKKPNSRSVIRDADDFAAYIRTGK